MQDLITRNRGCCTVVTGGQRVADSGLVASLVRSAAYRTQQEQHPSGASSAATAQMQVTEPSQLELVRGFGSSLHHRLVHRT